eukprot:bmy_02139T0
MESLRNSHSSRAEIQKGVEYRLPFTVNNLTISINILLPPQFPQEKPVISVYPPIRHHLVDEQGVYVTSPLGNNFTMRSDLGEIIRSLLDEFWKNPPVSVPASTAFPYRHSNQLYNSQTRSAAPSFGVLSNLPLLVPTTDTSALISQNAFGYKMPDIPDAFPELSELSVSQLTDMNEQEEVLLEQFLTLPQLKQIITDKDDLVRMSGNTKPTNVPSQGSIHSVQKWTREPSVSCDLGAKWIPYGYPKEIHNYRLETTHPCVKLTIFQEWTDSLTTLCITSPEQNFTSIFQPPYSSLSLVTEDIMTLNIFLINHDSSMGRILVCSIHLYLKISLSVLSTSSSEALPWFSTESSFPW